MSDIMLAKPILPDSSWIDLSVGEARVIKDIFINTFGFDKFTVSTTNEICEYPRPNGYAPLVKMLEDKYQAPVIITNGAKQGLAAAFDALHKLGKTKLGMRTPYWALIPPLAHAHGLECVDKKYDCYLGILPNNPDGFIFDNYEYTKYLSDSHKDLGVPLIHDAAYYCHTYLPDEFKLGPLGDMQIFSMSKMYGLSGFRLGYVVVYNKDYYNLMQQYMETMTVGVSTVSQNIMHQMLSEIEQHPEKERSFIVKSRDALYKAKFIARLINRDILEVPDNIENVPGMFLWCRKGKRCNFEKAKIIAIDGEAFGGPGMVRLNLALPLPEIIKAVEKLNNV